MEKVKPYTLEELERELSAVQGLLEAVHNSPTIPLEVDAELLAFLAASRESPAHLRMLRDALSPPDVRR